MKNLLFILALITTVSGCKCKKPMAENVQKTTTSVMSDCLPEANCFQEIHTDSALEIVREESGRPYYKIIPQVGTTVYRYELSEKQDEQYMDGGYREEIIFELPSDSKNEVISGKELTATKALFGVFCYCKGKAGYYEITDGNINKTAKEIQVSIPEIVEGQKVRTLVVKL